VDLVVQTHQHFDHFELKLEMNLLKKETKKLRPNWNKRFYSSGRNERILFKT
jgi:L-ascorbate metabolism protein UlaG (beta-lactamase superfamily)